MIGSAKHSDSGEEFIVYKALYGDGHLWVRPKLEFLGLVESGGRLVLRFTPVSSEAKA